MLSYRENNILFRIASADVISKFKSIQTHSLLQVCRKELNFDPSVREILLLSYDKFSSFILRLERLFLLMENYKIDNNFCEKLIQLINEELISLEEICNSHKNIFNLYGIKLLELIHEYSIKIFKIEIKKLNSEKIDKAFVLLIDLINEYLQHILVSLHELDNNFIKYKTPFLGLTNFCLLDKNNCPIIIRANFYKSLISNFKSVVIKNYTQENFSKDIFNKLNNIDIQYKLEKDEKKLNFNLNDLAVI